VTHRGLTYITFSVFTYAFADVKIRLNHFLTDEGMAKKSGGGAARGGKKREKRDREGGRDSSWKFASGSKALRLGQLGSDFVSAGYGEMCELTAVTECMHASTD
jgi:hypothetical protein